MTSPKLPTVYAVQVPMKHGGGRVEPMFDISPALMYGDIIQLLPPGPVLLETEVSVRTLKSKLAHFDDDDYILCLGDPVAIAAACMVASQVNGGAVKLLVYDRQDRRYNAIQIDLFGRMKVPA